MVKPSPHQLLVEGKNDQHVIWALCARYGLSEVFTVETPKNDIGGIDVLLKSLPIRLREENLQVLGVVIDADQNITSRWEAVRQRFFHTGYSEIPHAVPVEGWVSSRVGVPRVGIWLMPNNQFPGMLEDFVQLLLPTDDPLRPKAERVLEDIELSGLNRYQLSHHSKALIHTWLAWQEPPGMPMGQAITARALHYDSPLAVTFINWLKRLFELP